MIHFVSEKALVGRINRQLAKNYERLRKCPENSRDYHNQGAYYLVNTDRKWVIGVHVDLERYAKELGVLGPNERLAES